MDSESFPHLHEHELIREDEKKLDTDDVKMKECGICGFLMFMNPYYRCSEKDCNFLIHEQCADLPEKFTYQDVSLTLEKDAKKNQSCSKCGKTCDNFMYSNTSRRYQNFYYHPFCIFDSPKDIKTKHRSHHHPMTPAHTIISTYCDACGKEDKGHFLSCQVCKYWIHKECALLPSIGMCTASHKDHPLILLYSNPFSKRKSSWGTCGKCQEDIPMENAVYMCQACSYYVHLKCVKSEIKPLTQEESRKHIIDLPPAEKEYEVFPSFIIRNEQQEFNGTTTERMTLEECHNHPLTYHGSTSNDNNKKDDKKMLGVCDACVQPISSSCEYYSCSKIGCDFLVHELCATLSSTIIGRKFPGAKMQLFTKSTREKFHLFYCDICERYCDGFRYEIEYSTSYWPTTADVECASAPRIIKHESHNHILHLIQSSSLDYEQRRQFSCCTSEYTDFLYMCIICNLKIHVSCALLPKKVSHEFDEHPLQLITNNNNTHKKDDDFCEFCEEDIDPNSWFYYCTPCDQSFHVKCIPSVGDYSKFKFGGTIDGDSRSSHPHSDHPLTSVRMLTVGTQTCGYCEGIIHGFKDNVVFHCSTCDFWIHWHCARRDEFKIF